MTTARTSSRARRDPVVGSEFLGAASGLRSQIGIATVVVCSDPSLPSIFRQPWTKRLLVAAAAGELVVDKLPIDHAAGLRTLEDHRSLERGPRGQGGS